MDIMWGAVAEENSFRISCNLVQDEGHFHCLNFFSSVVIVNCLSFVLCVRAKWRWNRLL